MSFLKKKYLLSAVLIALCVFVLFCLLQQRPEPQTRIEPAHSSAPIETPTAPTPLNSIAVPKLPAALIPAPFVAAPVTAPKTAPAAKPMPAVRDEFMEAIGATSIAPAQAKTVVPAAHVAPTKAAPPSTPTEGWDGSKNGAPEDTELDSEAKALDVE